jgi:glycosyltransferase involved in cell wall biosynthesis
LNIAHVVPHVGAEAAGPSYSVPRLCEAQAALGHAVSLLTLALGRPIAGVDSRIFASITLPRGFGVSPGLHRAIGRAAATMDVVHNHSLWQMANISPGLAVQGKRALLVTSPRGTLSAWALQRSAGRKRLMRPLQWPALTRAGLLHATSMEELADIRRLGLRAPVAVIANGIDMPVGAPPAPAGPRRTLLFLGRQHPVKGIDRLLEAWARLAPQHPDWDLRIVGPGEPDHLAAVQRAAAPLARVTLEGPVYGAEKSIAYRSASLFVLPSHSENFGVAVAEALAHGLPAVVGNGAPWSGLVAEHAGWWVSNEAEPLAAALDEAMRLPAVELAAMGGRGRAWMARDFGWEGIAERMVAAYRFARGEGRRPDWVDA